MSAVTSYEAVVIVIFGDGGSTDWLIFLSVSGVWIAFFYLFRRRDLASRRLRSRELAEKIGGKSREPYEYIPVDADSVPGLRLQELQQSTEKLERLGFRRLSDHRLLGKGESTSHSFGRSLVNEELYCYVDLIATQKTLDTERNLIFGFSSFLEDGWSVGSSSGGSMAGHYVRRHPKSLVLYIRGCPLEELLDGHLELRNRVMKELDISAVQDTSPQGYRERVRQRMKERRQAFLKRDILGEWPEAKRIEQAGYWEWLGDYPQEAARRAKGKNLRPLMELSPTYRLPQSDALEKMGKVEDSGATDKSDG
jgi:hypothetical protein